MDQDRGLSVDKTVKLQEPFAVFLCYIISQPAGFLHYPFSNHKACLRFPVNRANRPAM